MSFFKNVKAALTDKIEQRKKAKKSVTWLRGMAKNKLKPAAETTKKEAFSKISLIGHFFIFAYDPKWKKVLPWYDKLPVVVIIEIYKDGFLGLNVHYLPPSLRGFLMDGLIRIMEKARKDENRYARMSYAVLRNFLKLRFMNPCVKRYLTMHIRSKLIRVEEKDWMHVAMLPIQQFEKATAQKVWRNVVK